MNRAFSNPHGTGNHPELVPLSEQTGIGEKLRLAREARGIALRDISEQTRISMRYLTAIETDDYKRLPGGIFNRSFIRAYARYIDYDEDQAIAEYADMMREQTDSPDEVPTKPHKSLVYTEGSTPNHSPAWTLVWAILILVALSLSIWGALHFYQRRAAPKAPTGASHPSSSARRAKAMDVSDSTIANIFNAKEERNEFAD